ncbi:hypothetical protein [Actinacidiphila reveromycinica]|uniref:hypothetical protein n=1 Tax=Actinacidiphila reveromycinica TaxID=659352 RepID=UPI003211B5DB
MDRKGQPGLLISPNSVLANALLRSIDILRPRVLAARPTRIEFVVGTQINGAPHLGTNLVQTAAFLLAKTARREFSIDTMVRFGALDNAPYEVVLDPETHTAYQQTYYHALGKDRVGELIDGYYGAFFASLSEATDTDYRVETYTDQQATPGFRAEFLRTLERLEDIRWWMAPSHGVVHVRVPCPRCGWAEKRADRTKLAHLDEDGATFTAVCLDHGGYEAHIDPEDDLAYLDLATLYRNLVKERTLSRGHHTLQVMMKGGDWVFGCNSSMVLSALSTPRSRAHRSAFSRRRSSPRPERNSPSPCCGTRVGTCCPQMSSPGCSTPRLGRDRLTTTWTHWSGWSAGCSPTPSTSSARSLSRNSAAS